jgi:hypothetical protein
VGQPGIAAVEAGMLKTVDRAACWIELDYATLGLSFPKLDSSMRNWDDFSTSGCKCWSTDHYPV